VRAATLGCVLAAVFALGCASGRPAPPVDSPAISSAPPPANAGGALGPADEVGLASWYGNALRGRPTASGEPFDPDQFTAAHKKLPFGTWVDVTRPDTGRTVRVRINDRGPNGRAAHRLIDLSARAAQELDIVRAGVVRVELRVVRGP
jgi:rare lipoprotein A